ncbi:hypothetical protein PFISCL1PPCAC_5865, partial [Pristionchus fissidentatus]
RSPPTWPSSIFIMRFFVSFLSLLLLLLPLISAFPNMIYNLDEFPEEEGLKFFQSKRGLVMPNNVLMLRNYPILRRV